MTDSLLQNITTPADIRALSVLELEQLAAQVRSRLIEVTAANGGHLASSLGAVEITIALHLLYDFASDRLIFDVGHQSYAHKILTGRDEAFASLRTYGGICGFPRRDESIYDAHDAGHASDSLSIAAGLVLARDLKGSSEQIVALIGDASLSGGMAFEALNQIGYEQLDMTIVLNDNEMSISRNVGALSLSLARLRMSKPYTAARDTLEGGLSRVGHPGKVLVRAGEIAKNSFKKLIVPGMFFEDMGIRYIGPIDGHSISALNEALRIAKHAKGPVVIHAVTRKGRGYAPAERQPDVFHGVGCFDAQTGELLKEQAATESYTTLFSKALVAEAACDLDIVAITAAMEDGTGLAAFRQAYPARFFDVGIAEEHAVALAAGLALGGKKPVVAIYSTFLQRALDQVMIDVAQQRQHVVFAVDRAGLVGEDGPTHHGSFDLAFLRTVPGLRILAPGDADDVADCLHTALALDDGPIALRYPRGNALTVASVERTPQQLPVGVARRLRQGSDAAILAVGRFVGVACAVAELLAEQGIGVMVYNMLWVKPLDSEAVLAASDTGLVVTLEDGVVQGGLGTAVLETIATLDDTNLQAQPKVVRLGLPDAFVPHGATPTLFEELGLSVEAISQRILCVLKAE